MLKGTTLMKMCLISDTYGNLPEIKEDCDILVHAGNFCPILEEESYTWNIMNQGDWIDAVFNPWLKKQKAKNIIVMPGQTDYVASYHGRDLHYLLYSSYIQDDSVFCCGNHIYGIPWIYKDNVKQSRNVNIFNYYSKELLGNAINNIPSNTDILISRMCPYGILDLVEKKNIGSTKLLSKIDEIQKLKIVVIGGVGKGSGNIFPRQNTRFINCSYSKDVQYSIIQF